MIRMAFQNGRVATAASVLPGVTLHVDARGRIAAIAAPATAVDVDETIDLDGGWLVAGFVDTQINGGGGVLFNDAPNIDTIAAIGAAHIRFGTTAFLPTLISDGLDVMATALDAVDRAIDAGVPGVVGIHIEGPFINPTRRGTHDVSKFRRLDAEAMRLLTRPRRGRVMVTLAPELCTLDDIATLAAANVLVSAGHSDADHATIVRALAGGLRGFTHLFNAMSPLAHRAPGVVGAALDDEESWCGLIADRVHVDPAVLRIALRAKRHDRMMLVTDAMPCVGGPDSFMLNGKRIEVVDGRCLGPDGTLAGSDLDMASAVRNIVAIAGIDVPDAVRMASAVPAGFLRLSDERGALAPGLVADWVWLDRDLRVQRVWSGGRAV